MPKAMCYTAGMCQVLVVWGDLGLRFVLFSRGPQLPDGLRKACH
jgi:hypothetical protein